MANCCALYQSSFESDSCVASAALRTVPRVVALVSAASSSPPHAVAGVAQVQAVAGVLGAQQALRVCQAGVRRHERAAAISGDLSQPVVQVDDQGDQVGVAVARREQIGDEQRDVG
jgi:hypothetical protein